MIAMIIAHAARFHVRKLCRGGASIPGRHLKAGAVAATYRACTMVRFGRVVLLITAVEPLSAATSFHLGPERLVGRAAPFDGIIDFDALLRDPANPDRMLPAYDCDGIHPNVAGHESWASPSTWRSSDDVDVDAAVRRAARRLRSGPDPTTVGPSGARPRVYWRSHS